MKSGKFQFKHQTNQVASQKLSLLSPLAPNKGHSLPPPPVCLSERGNEQSRLWSKQTYDENISRPAY